MKYLTGVLFLASCAMLTPSPVEDRAIRQPGAATGPEPGLQQPDNRPEIRKPRVKPSPPPPSSSPSTVSSCADLDAGNLKETIKAKLDCITENAK